MPNVVDLIVDLKAVANDAASRKFELGDSYFASLDQEEILGGQITATVSVKEAVSNCFSVHLSVGGCVRVACDRCLDPVELPVEAEEEFKVLDELPEDDLDSRCLERGAGYAYDLSWDVYELAALALPIQRVHEPGACNGEMAARLKEMEG